MAVVIGVSAGFVTTAPSSNPGDASVDMDGFSRATRDTSPSGAETVTEIGWYSTTPSGDGNYEVGIYTDDAINDEPEAVVGSLDTSNTKAAGATRWEVATGLNISISPSTIYWVAVQLDDVAGGARTQWADDSGTGSIFVGTTETALPDPTWNIGGTYDSSSANAIYAKVTVAAPLAPYTSMNVGDDWKSISGAGVAKIKYVDHTWGTISGAWVNHADSWGAITLS